MAVVAVVLIYVVLCVTMCLCLSGSEYESVHRGSGPADSERSAVCGENGSSAEGSGKQIQTGGRRTREQHRQTVQGTVMALTTKQQLSKAHCKLLHFIAQTKDLTRS